MNRRSLGTVRLFAGAVAVAGASSLLANGQAPLERTALDILPLRGNVYLLHGAGANITVSVGREGALLVDSGREKMAPAVVAAVQALIRQVASSPSPVKPCAGLGCVGVAFPSYYNTIASPPPPPPIRFIVNTTHDADHTGGNAAVAAAGATFGTGPGLGPFQAMVRSSAMIYAHESVLLRMAASQAPSAALPTETFLDDFEQYVNGEGIQMFHLPMAHSSGDLIVHFRGSDVISTGDVFSTTRFPEIDARGGGSIDGVIDGLNRLLDLAVPEYQSEGGTLLVPGHGRVSDLADVAVYRDAMTIVRDRVRAMIAQGMTLAQVKAARPTRAYDTRYATAEWTSEQFVEAVYTSLNRP
jgi:cyclase